MLAKSFGVSKLPLLLFWARHSTFLTADYPPSPSPLKWAVPLAEKRRRSSIARRNRSEGLSEVAGRFRIEQVALFNDVGERVAPGQARLRMAIVETAWPTPFSLLYKLFIVTAPPTVV